MRRKLAVFITGVTCAALLLGGCAASNDASNEYVNLSGYKEVEVPDVTEPDEITDEDVDSYLEAVLAQYSTTEQIKDREVKSGDTVNIDFVGKIDGEEFAGGSSQGVDLEIGSGSFIAGFEDSIIGHKPGDTFDWNGKFPDDYGAADYAGKDVVFTITVNYINGETIQAELTDELVKDLSDTATTVDEYRAEVKKQLTENNTLSFDTSLQESSWEAVLEKAEIKSYPEGMVEEEEEKLINYYKEAAEANNMEFADFLSANGMEEEQFYTLAHEAAEGSIKQRLVAEAIAEKEKLIPSDEELKEEYQKMADDYGFETVDDLIEQAGEEELRSTVILQKVKEFLAKNAIQVKK